MTNGSSDAAPASSGAVHPLPLASRLIELAIGAAWLIGLAAALELLGVLLGQSPLAAALAGAVVVDLGTGRAGVRWDAPSAPPEPAPLRSITRNVGLGAGLGAIAVALTFGVALLAGWATVGLGRPSAGLGLALVRASAGAIRDELLLTGLPFAVAARAGVPSAYALAFAALAHGAGIAIAPGASAASLTLALASGALFAALFWRTRGAWSSIAASASFRLLAGAWLRGGLLDVTWQQGALAAGVRAFGWPAWVAALVCGVLAGAVVLHGRGRRAHGALPAP